MKKIKNLLTEIKEGRISLTEKEKLVLQTIRSQGSFFEEAGGNEHLEKWDSAFLGWQVNKGDPKIDFSPAGVVSSLVKKGILHVNYDYDTDDGKPLAMYYVLMTLDFSEENDDILVFE